jgi:hypothetical protein
VKEVEEAEEVEEGKERKEGEEGRDWGVGRRFWRGGKQSFLFQLGFL